MRKPKVLTAEEKLEVVLRRLDTEKLRCFDTETSGLTYWNCHIVGWVMTFSPNPADSYYLPFRHAGGGNIGGQRGPQDRYGWDRKTLHPAERALIKKFDRPGVTNFGHNVGFDLKFAWEAGMRKHAARYEDTSINAPLLDEFQGRFSLEACANIAKVLAKKSREIMEHIAKQFPQDCDVDVFQGDRTPMAHFWRLAGDDPVAVDYAEGDGTSTWQLRDWQMPQIEAQELTLVHDIESRLTPILTRMTLRGIRVDEERLNKLIEVTDDDIERLSALFWDGFNSKSPRDVEKWLTDQGQTEWEYSAGRKVRQRDGSFIRVPQKSFKEEWLLKQPAGKRIIEVRKLKTLRTSFLGPLRDAHVRDGRVHPEIHQLRNDEFGTVTGRLSESNPNLTAVTKHDVEVGKLHRSVFVADKGRKFATRDYSQIEPRLLGFYTGAKVLWDGYLADPPIDAHTSVSMNANKRWHEMTPAEQKAYRNNFGKRINQTVITGGGKGVLVAKYGVPANEVDGMLRDYHRVLPELRPFQKQAARTFRYYGFVFSLLRRRARLIHPDKDYTATNRLLQCGNADILKLKMVEIGEFLEEQGRPEEVDMLNAIHDDLCFQFVPGYGRELFDRCGEIMVAFGPNEVIDLDGMPMVVDDGIGNDWAEATYSFTWDGGQPPYMTRKRNARKDGLRSHAKGKPAQGTLFETAYASRADKKRLARQRAGV